MPAVHMCSLVAIPPKVSIRTYRRSVAGRLRHNLWGPLSLDVVTTYICTTTRLAADYSRQQVMEVVGDWFGTAAGKPRSPHKGKELGLPAVRCDHCRVDPPLHPLRPPKPSFLPQAFQPKAYFTKNSDRWLMNRPWRRKAADRSAGDERSCNKERKICACF